MRLAIARLQLTPAQVVVVTTQPRTDFLQTWEQLAQPQLGAALEQATELEAHLRFIPFALDPSRVFSLIDEESKAQAASLAIPGYSWQAHQDAHQLENAIVHWVVADGFFLAPKLLGIWEREMASLAAHLHSSTSHQNQLVAQLTLLEDGTTTYSPAAQEQLLTVIHYLLRKYQFLTPDYLGVDANLLAQLGIAPANIAQLERSLETELNPAPHHQRIARTPLNNTLFVDRSSKDSPIGNVFTSDLKLTTEAAYATASSLGIDVTGTILEDYNPEQATDYEGILGFIALAANGTTAIPAHLRQPTTKPTTNSVHQPRGGLLAGKPTAVETVVDDAEVIVGAANYAVIDDIERVQSDQGNTASVTDYFAWGTTPQHSDLPAVASSPAKGESNPQDLIPSAWLDYFKRNPHLASWYANLADTGLASVRNFWEHREPETCMGRIQFQAWGLTAQSYNFLNRWQELQLSRFSREELLQVAPPSRLTPYFFYDYTDYQSNQRFDSFETYKLELLHLEQVAPVLQQAYLRTFFADYAALLVTKRRNLYWTLDAGMEAPMKDFLQRFLMLQVEYSRALYLALEQRKLQVKLSTSLDQALTKYQNQGKEVARTGARDLLEFALELPQAHALLEFVEQVFTLDALPTQLGVAQVAPALETESSIRASSKPATKTLADYSQPVQALGHQLLTQCINWVNSTTSEVHAYRNDLQRLKYANCVFDLRDNLTQLCADALITLPEFCNFHAHNIVWLEHTLLPLELVQFPEQHLVVHTVGSVGALHAAVQQQVSGVNQLLQIEYHLSHHRYLDFAHSSKHVDNAQLMRRLQMYYHTHPSLEQETITQHVAEHLLGLRVQRMHAHAELAQARQMIGANRTQLQAFEDLLSYQVEEAGSLALEHKSDLETRLEQTLERIEAGAELEVVADLDSVTDAGVETTVDLTTRKHQLMDNLESTRSSLPQVLFASQALGQHATAVYDLQLNQLLTNQETIHAQDRAQGDYASRNRAWQAGLKQRLLAVYQHLQRESGLATEAQAQEEDTTTNTILDIWRGHQGPIFWHSLYTKNKIYPVLGMEEGDPVALDSYKRQIMVQLYVAPYRDWQPYISKLPRVMQGEIQVQYPHFDLGIEYAAIQEFLASKNVNSLEEYHQQYLANFTFYRPLYNLPFVWSGFSGAYKYLSALGDFTPNGKVMVFIPESHTHELAIQASSHYKVDYHKLLFWTHNPQIVRSNKATGGCNMQQPAAYAPFLTPFTFHELRDLLSVYAFNQELGAIPESMQQVWQRERQQQVSERNFLTATLDASQADREAHGQARENAELPASVDVQAVAQVENVVITQRASYAEIYQAWLTYVIETAPLVLAYQRHTDYQVERVLFTSFNREEELALFLQFPQATFDLVESERSNALQPLLGMDHAFVVRDWVALYQPYTQAATSRLRRAGSPVYNLFYNRHDIYKSLNVENLRFNITF